MGYFQDVVSFIVLCFARHCLHVVIITENGLFGQLIKTANFSPKKKKIKKLSKQFPGTRKPPLLAKVQNPEVTFSPIPIWEALRPVQTLVQRAVILKAELCTLSSLALESGTVCLP